MIRIKGTIDRNPAAFALLSSLAEPDLYPLAESIRGIVVDGNRRGLVEGTDAGGNAMSPLAESTRLDRRRGGDGEPLVPRGDGSRMIAEVSSGVAPTGGGNQLVTVEWPGIAAYHRGATRYRPARDPVGIRPDDRLLMGDAAREFASDLLLRVGS